MGVLSDQTSKRHQKTPSKDIDQHPFLGGNTMSSGRMSHQSLPALEKSLPVCDAWGECHLALYDGSGCFNVLCVFSYELACMATKGGGQTAYAVMFKHLIGEEVRQIIKTSLRANEFVNTIFECTPLLKCNFG